MLPDKSRCCGCELCSSVCLKQAISMEEDRAGFIYPVIETEKCVNCSLCERICPELNHPIIEKCESKRVYGGYLTNEEKLKESSSGGLATAVMEKFAKSGNVIYGVSWENDFKSAVYVRVKGEDEIYRLRGTKYIQSNKNLIYRDVKKDLQDNRKVLFIGLPCEVAALRNYIKDQQKLLYTCELVCHGPTSKKVGREFIEKLEKKYKSVVIGLNLRYKQKEWNVPYIWIEFENGKVFTAPFYQTEYGRAFYLLARECCYSCSFKGQMSVADITIGDFWGLSRLDGNYNELGVSMAIVHSDKGEELLQDLENFRLFMDKYENAIKSNADIYESRTHKPRENVFKTAIEKNTLFQACLIYDGMWTRGKVMIKKCLKVFPGIWAYFRRSVMYDERKK